MAANVTLEDLAYLREILRATAPPRDRRVALGDKTVIVPGKDRHDRLDEWLGDKINWLYLGEFDHSDPTCNPNPLRWGRAGHPEDEVAPP